MRRLHEFQKHRSMLQESGLPRKILRLLADQDMRQHRIRNKQNLLKKH